MLNFKALALFAGLAIACLLYLNHQVKSLESDLRATERIAQAHQLQLDVLVSDFKGLKTIDESRSKVRIEQQKETKKLTKDSARSNVVLKKPKLVETKINDSFDKFSKNLQELSQ